LAVETQVARARAKAQSSFHAFISLTDDQAETSVAVKDIIDVAGLPTTCGAPVQPRTPSRDAPLIARIRKSGSGIVGKTNLHEWSCGITSDNRTYGPVLNPADTERIPGGSSGGSAVAVRLGLCDWALGSDTGGSIRIPASFCGVVGFKPTTGSLPAEGVIGVSETLDALGPMADDVTKVGQAYAVLQGVPPPAEWDAEPVDLEAWPRRFGVPVDWMSDLDEITRTALRPLLDMATAVELPPLDEFTQVQQTVVRFEASRLHWRRLKKHPEDFAADVAKFLRAGLPISPAEHVSALARRVALAAQIERRMGDLGALILPTTPCVAPLRSPRNSASMDIINRFTRPFSVSGQPAITVPVPGTPLPVGVQLVGRRGEDWDLLCLARTFETQIRSQSQSRDASREGLP